MIYAIERNAGQRPGRKKLGPSGCGVSGGEATTQVTCGDGRKHASESSLHLLCRIPMCLDFMSILICISCQLFKSKNAMPLIFFVFSFRSGRSYFLVNCQGSSSENTSRKINKNGIEDAKA
jgi:hypothetical protein